MNLFDPHVCGTGVPSNRSQWHNADEGLVPDETDPDQRTCWQCGYVAPTIAAAVSHAGARLGHGPKKHVAIPSPSSPLRAPLSEELAELAMLIRHIKEDMDGLRKALSPQVLHDSDDWYNLEANVLGLAVLVEKLAIRA